MTTTELFQLASNVGDLLIRKRAIVTTAESCTGGGIAAAMTAVPGASRWFDCAFVTYSNAAKSRMLGISPELIMQHGAVSHVVVAEMAAAAATRAHAGYSVAVSGVAGPGGDSADKPVGTVWIAWFADGRLLAEKQCFPGDREAVRLQTVQRALSGLIELLESTV